MAKILVTGGTGYIGSHTVVELQNAGFEVFIVDNLSNSDAKVVDRIEKITGIRPAFKILIVLNIKPWKPFLKKITVLMPLSILLPVRRWANR